MRRIRVTSPARKDLQEIRKYLKLDSPQAASRVTQEIRAGIARLAEQPGIGHVREDLTDATIRFLAVWSYLVIYDFTETEVTILRVLHGARDLEKLLDQESD